MWDRLRTVAFDYRGYRGFNTLDRVALVAMGIGGVMLVGGFLFDADGVAGPGLFMVIIGMLTLLRAFPGEGG